MRIRYTKNKKKKGRNTLQNNGKDRKTIQPSKVAKFMYWAEEEILKEAVLDTTNYTEDELVLIKNSLESLYIYGRLLGEVLFDGSNRIQNDY